MDCNDLIITVNGVVNCNNYPFDSTSFSINGTNIEIGVYYTASFVCTGALNPYAHNVNLGNVPEGTYSISINGYLNLNVDDVLTAPSITIGSCCPVSASYTSDLNVGCTSDATPITFTNTSTGATSSEWFIDNISAGTGNTLTLPTATIGSYDVKLVSTDGSCSDSLSQTYNVYNNPVVNVGADTTSCLGQTYSINAGAGFSHYEWTNNSSTTETAIVNSTNTYKVSVTDANGCTASDSVLVTFNTPPTFSLGNDTSICAGDNLVLDPGAFIAYQWNTAETTQTISVNTSFNYGVTVTDANGCEATENISVLVNALPNVYIGADTIAISDGTNTTLNAGSFSSYLWHTSETTSSVNIATEGPVSVTVTNANNCSNTAETYVKINDLPNINFGADTLSFCSGNAVTLSPGVFSNYTWSNATTNPTLSVNTPGEVSVSVMDDNNCSNTDSVFVKENANPVVNLGEDKDLCTDEKISLNGGNFASYLWNDGSTLASLEINGADYNEGNYSFDLSVTDENACTGNDEIVINVKKCDVGISSTELENSISIFPIPVKNFLNIDVESNTLSNVKIFNVLGKNVISVDGQTLNANSKIDLSDLNEGIYFIEITIENERLVKQFLKGN